MSLLIRSMAGRPGKQDRNGTNYAAPPRPAPAAHAPGLESRGWPAPDRQREYPVTIDPERLRAMQAFAARALSDETLTFEPASADASFRSYWRATSSSHGGTWVVMDAPPGKESLGPAQIKT